MIDWMWFTTPLGITSIVVGMAVLPLYVVIGVGLALRWWYGFDSNWGGGGHTDGEALLFLAALIAVLFGLTVILWPLVWLGIKTVQAGRAIAERIR